MVKIYHHTSPVVLENGSSLSSLQIAYHTYGRLNAQKDNVVWICHALTASSDAGDWWDGLVGKDKVFCPDKYYIICANILGSCYGTTGPASTDPATGKPYGSHFPGYTIRDMVTVHRLLKAHLNISAIAVLAGGSMGGYQAFEWSISHPDEVKRLFLLATSSAESAWGIAIHTAQRMAISADPDWQTGIRGRGDKGLKAARAIGMLTYRNYDVFRSRQSDNDPDKLTGFRATSYIEHQADKLALRFDALTYYKLTEAMDTHNLTRSRQKDMSTVLQEFSRPVLLIGISSDILCPPREQRMLAAHLPHCTYCEIDSDYGHDGFLIEHEVISKHLSSWLKSHTASDNPV